MGCHMFSLTLYYTISSACYYSYVIYTSHVIVCFVYVLARPSCLTFFSLVSVVEPLAIEAQLEIEPAAIAVVEWQPDDVV